MNIQNKTHIYVATGDDISCFKLVFYINKYFINIKFIELEANSKVVSEGKVANRRFDGRV